MYITKAKLSNSCYFTVFLYTGNIYEGIYLPYCRQGKRKVLRKQRMHNYTFVSCDLCIHLLINICSM